MSGIGVVAIWGGLWYISGVMVDDWGLGRLLGVCVGRVELWYIAEAVSIILGLEAGQDCWGIPM